MTRRGLALVGTLAMCTIGVTAPSADGAGVTIRSCIYNAGRNSGEVAPSTGTSSQGVDMSRDGATVLYADTSNGGQLRLRTRSTGAVIDAPAGVDAAAAWSGDLRRVAFVRTAGPDLELVVVDRATNTTTVALSQPAASELSAEGISDDGALVVFTVADGVGRAVKRVTVATHTIESVSATDGATYGGVTASADARFVVAVRNSAEVWLYDLQTPSSTLVGAGIRAMVSPGGSTVAWIPSLAGSLHLYDVAGASDSTPSIPASLIGPNRLMPADMSTDGRFLLMSGVISGTPDPFDWRPLVFDRQSGTVEPFAAERHPETVGAAISDDGNHVLTGETGVGSPDLGMPQAYVVDRGATTVYVLGSVTTGRPGAATLYGNSLPTSVDGVAAAPAGVAIGTPAVVGPHTTTMSVDSWPGPARRVRLTLTGANGCRVNVPAFDLLDPAPTVSRVGHPAGEYHSVKATRLAQRRQAGMLAVPLTVGGRFGIPTSGVQSVVLNVTVSSPTASGSLTVFPTGTARPATPTAAYSPTRFSSNLVIAKLGTGGAVNLFISAGRALVTVDIVGWFSTAGSANRAGLAIDPQPPVRAYDSRQHGARPAAGNTYFAPDTGGGVGVLASVTVISPAADGALLLRPAYTSATAQFPSGPVTVRFKAGQTVTNLALVPVGQFGQFEVVTSASTHFVIDIVGVVQPRTTTHGEVVRSTPVTRLGPALWAAGVARSVKVVGVGGVPANAKSVVVNLTSVSTLASGTVTVWRSGWTRPSAPNLNTAKGATVSNLAIVPIGADGRIAVQSTTRTGMIIDIVGYTVSG